MPQMMPQMMPQTCLRWCPRHAPDDVPDMPQMMPHCTVPGCTCIAPILRAPLCGANNGSGECPYFEFHGFLIDFERFQPAGISKMQWKIFGLNFRWDEYKVGPFKMHLLVQNVKYPFEPVHNPPQHIDSTTMSKLKIHLLCKRAGRLLKSGFFVLKYWLNISAADILPNFWMDLHFHKSSTLKPFQRVAFYTTLPICKYWLLIVNSNSC